MSGREPRAARPPIPPSTAANPYPGRNPHWIKPNATERIPVRWIVADTETLSSREGQAEVQRLRCWDAVRWRTDLKTGEHRELAAGESAVRFWQWCLEWCHTHGRTVLWFHHAGFDLAVLDAFTHLPAMGCELVWCNLDREVSVATWRTPGGTLVIADTYTWTNQPLSELAPMVEIVKPELPGNADDLATWHHRCLSDVLITEEVVRQLLAFIRTHHLGNWQPSGAGMGHTAWRHRWYEHKVLVHDDADAIAAEREAMHAGRAEAWWHGRAEGGPFTEWDMTMSYTTIAAECHVPAKLWAHDPRPTSRVHRWALEHWRVLARVIVRTKVPVVPARRGGRIVWPVGQFTTVLWDTELALLEQEGGSYEVLEQWRYTRKPALAGWANWTRQMLALEPPAVPLVARTWLKHQARATIGRMGLRTASWEPYADNWLPGYTGVSLLTEEGSGTRRLMHVGHSVWRETDLTEGQQSVPMIPSWIMAEARVRLWRAARAAGLENVLHVDTDSLLTNAAGTARLELATREGLPGAWRPKGTWRSLEIIGPRHYFTPHRKQVPGVPKRARQVRPGVWRGEIWESMATALHDGRTGEVRTLVRQWEPKRVDYRRPYAGEETGPAVPMTVTLEEENQGEHNPAPGDRGRRGVRDGAPGSHRRSDALQAHQEAPESARQARADNGAPSGSALRHGRARRAKAPAEEAGRWPVNTRR